jgi:hypothetical protein
MKKLVVTLAGAALGIVAGLLLMSRSTARRGDAATESTAGRPVHPSESTAEPKRSAQADEPGKSQITPPHFVAQSTSRVENDPMNADYDPVKLAGIGHRSAAIFAAEPRVEEWAGPMERMLEKRVAAHLELFSNRAKMASVECRSSSCLVGVDAPDEDAARVNMALQVPPLGDLIEPSVSGEVGQEGWRRLNLHVLFRKENRDFETYARLQKERRKMFLEALKKDQNFLVQMGIDPAKLPPSETSGN